MLHEHSFVLELNTLLMTELESQVRHYDELVQVKHE